jgi:uncharacterized membrane protein YraQ (UPF0718 family)
MLRAKGLQFDFAAGPRPSEPPGWLDWVAKAFHWLAPVLKWVFWIGLAVIAGLILYFLVRELLGVRLRRRKGAAARPAAADWRPDVGRARALLEDADRLAAEGCYDEAARLLLHRSVEDFQGRRPGAVRPALTSRDIAALPSMPAAARAAFAAIAAAVEASFFGARPLDAAAFATCRDAYERFAFPEAWA